MPYGSLPSDCSRMIWCYQTKLNCLLNILSPRRTAPVRVPAQQASVSLHGLPGSVPLGFNFFLLLFELAHRAFSRLRPRCRRPRTMRRPLASRATPALRLPPSAARPSFAVSAACLRLLRRRCEDCLRRLRRRCRQRLRRIRRLLLPLSLGAPLKAGVHGASFFVIPLLAYCSVIFLLRSGHLPMLGFPSAQIPLQWLLCCRSFVCSPRGS